MAPTTTETYIPNEKHENPETFIHEKKGSLQNPIRFMKDQTLTLKNKPFLKKFLEKTNGGKGTTELRLLTYSQRNYKGKLIRESTLCDYGNLSSYNRGKRHSRERGLRFRVLIIFLFEGLVFNVLRMSSRIKFGLF